MLLSVCDAVFRAPRFRGQQRLARFLHRWAGFGVIRSRYGPLINNRPGDLTNFYYVSGFDRINYGDVFTEVNKLKPGECFLDIGANAGLFSLIASPLVKEEGLVISFEPSLRIYQDLIANIALNGAGNVFPVNAALGTDSARARFSSGSEDHSGVGHLDDNGETTIFQVNFDKFVPLFSPIIGDRSVIVKIDVEGAEAQVLASMKDFLSRKAVYKVIIEIDPQHLSRFGTTPADIYDCMTSHGFTHQRGPETSAHFNEVFNRAY